MDTDDDTRAPDLPQPLRCQWIQTGESKRWHAQFGRFRLAVTTYSGRVQWSVHLPGQQDERANVHVAGPAPSRLTAKQMAESAAEAMTELLRLVDFATPRLAVDPGAEQLPITTHHSAREGQK